VPDHLGGLPLRYFATRPTGWTVARVREVETIRNFLASRGLSSIIDLLFAIVFVVVSPAPSNLPPARRLSPIAATTEPGLRILARSCVRGTVAILATAAAAARRCGRE
jgi:hypothetical protein